MTRRDKNQAIFNGSAKLDDIWEDRDTVLILKGSYRLTNEVANIVKFLGLDFIEIEGRYVNTSCSNIKPRIIVFEDHSKENVIPEFANLIKQLQKENKLPSRPKYPFKAIAWRKNKLDNGKLGLKNYWDDFENNNHKPKEDYSCIESYLLHCKNDTKSLKSANNNIVNALLRILRYENIHDDNNRNYTKRTLLSFLKEKNDEQQYEKLKVNLYQWSIGIVRDKTDAVLSEIKSYIPEFLSIFEKTINRSRDFIDGIKSETQEAAVLDSVKSGGNNIFEKDDIRIEVTTVHSVKGQTHTATLYMESFYNRGQGHYESERLLEQFKGNILNGDEIKVVKQSAKMAYVGFSRPTHLLCFAIHKNRFNEEIFKDRWKIIYHTEGDPV